jgi:hypothetical protein
MHKDIMVAIGDYGATARLKDGLYPVAGANLTLTPIARWCAIWPMMSAS